jgi:hypothetical protein
MRVERIGLPEQLTESTAKQFIGRIASVCTGVECKSDAHAERVGEKNLTEAYGGTPTRAWEFLPIYVMGSKWNNFRSWMNRYGVLNFDRSISSYNYRKDFHIFHITAPRYVMAHLKTHTTLSSMMSSVRIGCNGEKEYEFPEIEDVNHDGFGGCYICDIKGVEVEYEFAEDEYELSNNNGSYFAINYPSEVFTEMMKYNYKRPEITKRPLSDFEVVEMKICGYSDAWDWFIKQRSEKGVQKETREIANMIKELIK